MNIKTLKNVFNPLRIFSIVFFTVFFFFFFLLLYLMFGPVSINSDIDFGVTFSQVSANEVEIDWQKAYTSILDDLEVRNLRLIAYWSLIEENKGEYLFNDLDWQVNEAKKRGAKVILAFGSKLPGPLKCYNPEWTKELSIEEKQENALLFIKEVVSRYDSEDTITTWQVEDDPLGWKSEDCINMNEEFLDKEIALVEKNNFSNKPILLTTSGEFSSWLKPATLGDKLGISISRTNWTNYLGYFKYPINSVFYKKRANLNRILTKNDDIIVTDLQTEPIGPKPILKMSSTDWEMSMSLVMFRSTITYVKETGFDEVYLRGVEWWYYMKGEGDDSFWNEAKKLWSE